MYIAYIADCATKGLHYIAACRLHSKEIVLVPCSECLQLQQIGHFGFLECHVAPGAQHRADHVPMSKQSLDHRWHAVLRLECHLKHLPRKASPPVQRHLARCREIQRYQHLSSQQSRHDDVRIALLTGAIEVVADAFRFSDSFDLLLFI